MPPKKRDMLVADRMFVSPIFTSQNLIPSVMVLEVGPSGGDWLTKVMFS